MEQDFGIQNLKSSFQPREISIMNFSDTIKCKKKYEKHIDKCLREQYMDVFITYSSQ